MTKEIRSKSMVQPGVLNGSEKFQRAAQKKLNQNESETF